MVLQRLFHSLRHFGRIGRVASRRGFLMRERRKLLLKLGDKAYDLMEAGKLHNEELGRIASQVRKIQKLLEREDYGGEEGVSFAGPSKRRQEKTKKG